MAGHVGMRNSVSIGSGQCQAAYPYSVHQIAEVLEYMGQYITLVLSIIAMKPNNSNFGTY